ncbi:hypothetical protein QM012_005214 [Aureobasidium pullulans]|uniref:Uncharacterized protein n=1 Tax=Aureobasidium pullulans TaxID=5580 RepID=A0ABR0T5V0_AURPU
MLRGTTTDGLAVKSVVKKVTGDEELSNGLCLKNVGLSLDGKNIGDCDLKIEAKTIQSIQEREIIQLQESSMSKVLDTWFAATDPIKWVNNQARCSDCLQHGDPRAFSRCHKSIQRIHREKAKHLGIQVLIHGPRDMKEKTVSILKKLAIGISAAGLATGAIMTAAITIVAPNPDTLVLTGTLLHMTISAASITAGATIATSATQAFGETVVDPRAPAAMITAGGLDVTAEQIKQLSKDLKGFTKRGECKTCHEPVDRNPCTYVWACCKRSFRKGEDALADQDPMFDGCKAVCTHCNKILVQDVKKKEELGFKVEIPGCLNQCGGCGAIEDEKDFSDNGCGSASHNLVYLPPLR